MSDALPPPPSARPEDQALQYTHSGGRYLLGYANAYFGIWERSRPDVPTERFPRTEEGWRRAWLRYVTLEPFNSEVGLGPPAVAAAPPPRAPAPRASAGRPDSPAWWLLPILMGWMGGLIAWLMIRDADRARARAMLITGIVATVAWIALYSVVLPPTP